MTKIGALALVGSGEYLPVMQELESALINSGVSNGKPNRFLQIPTAAGEESHDRLQFWESRGAEQARRIGTIQDFLPVFTREDAFNIQYISRVKDAALIYFSGGDPGYLANSLRDTPLWAEIEKNWLSGASLAGCSAGAMAMSSTMIYQGSSSVALMKGEVKITTGLAFMNNVIIDSHFVTRGRFGRLAEAVAGNPGCIGIGLGEDTGVLVTEGNKLEAIGSGLIILFDGHEIKHSNIADVEHGAPLSIEHLIIHVMAKGNHYNVKSRKFFSDHVEVAKTDH
jgi:cyanophycinase